MEANKPVTVQTVIDARLTKVWPEYTSPDHIVKWNAASEDWHTVSAVNDLRNGGRFAFRMEAKDGSEGFDFSGTYTDVKINELIAYTMDDNRKVRVEFKEEMGKTTVTVTFDPENENPIDMQREGWQAILDNFKKYVESSV